MADPIWSVWSTGSSFTSAASNTWGNPWRSWVTGTGGTDVASGVWGRWTTVFATGPVIAADDGPGLDLTPAPADPPGAVARAERLLSECLSPGQRRELRRHGRFTVDSQHGRRYEIRRGRSGNVTEIDGRRRGRPALADYCIHPIDHVPDADTMLAQKLLLEADEDTFHRLANRTVLCRVGRGR